MAKTPDQMLETMKANLLEKTGKTLEEWIAVVKASGLEKHGEQVKLLKEQGVGHGYASMICHAAKGDFETPDDDLVAAQYTGKEALRPIYDAITVYGAKLGKDVAVTPRKTNVTLRRSKNFAVITAATKTRIDLGINLKGMPGTGRLMEEKPGSMCTHKVRLESVADVDDEVRAWLKEAYDRA